jgi:hypothetical protein
VNLRLYRTSWIVAAIGMVIALLTLQAPALLPESSLPPTFDTGSALDLTAEVERASRSRPAGSPADNRAADLVRRRLLDVPGSRRQGGAERVIEQSFSARDAGGRLIRMRNVFLALPATGAGVGGGILVVAPRDTPSGVAAGASSTGIMLQLARLRATTVRRRPIIFISTDGSTVGNSGIRWFLSRFSDFDIAAALVLDAPGEGRGRDLHVWSRGSSTASALDLLPTVERAVERAGGAARLQTGVLGQIATGAMPQTFGDQGPLIAEGIPTVTLSNRSDTPLADDIPPSGARIDLAGRTAVELLGALDVADSVRDPETSYWLNGRIVRVGPLRAVALLLLLPALVLAVDAWSRLRRTRGLTGGGLRALARKAAALGAAAATGYLVSLTGAFAGTAAGAPPLPGDVEFGAGAVLGLALMVGAGLATHAALRRRAAPPDAESEIGATMLVLVVLFVALWWVNPFAAIVAAPAAHACVLAARPHPPAAVGALALLVLVPPVILIAGLAPRLDAGAPYALWYALETAVSGARGLVVPALAVGVAACLWAVAEPLAAGWQPRPLRRRRRPRRRRRSGRPRPARR